VIAGHCRTLGALVGHDYFRRRYFQEFQDESVEGVTLPDRLRAGRNDGLDEDEVNPNPAPFGARH
jgi:hypothetical protein